MSFKLREKEGLKVPFFCVDIVDGKMVSKRNRFNFHESTRKHFKAESDQDLCHRYSFSAILQLLCIIYNAHDPREYSKIEQLIIALYPYKKDRDDALEIFNKIKGTSNKNISDLVTLFNELLYVLNNALDNLRAGDSSWNRSIGAAYDPIEYYYDQAKKRIYITDTIDIYILSNLYQIYVEPSTIHFYSAIKDGKPFLYSSDNPYKNEGTAAYEISDIPIYIRPLTEDGTEFEMKLTD